MGKLRPEDLTRIADKMRRTTALRDGAARAIYSEEIDLRTLGRPWIVRASHVEPDAEGRWFADLGP